MLKDSRHTLDPPSKYGLPPEREAEAVLLNPANWPPGVTPFQPKGLSKGALPVKANHGRWIVECPCGSAQHASRTDKRFWCVECGNASFGGKWVSVEWPGDVALIEKELEKRLFHRNRNWAPGEKVADLRAEYAAVKILGMK